MLQLKHIHFIVYACVFTMYGALVTAVGPIIIYISQITGQDQTYYSFIFLARAFGYLIGGSLAKVIALKFQYHSTYKILIVICGISLIINSLNFGAINLCITMLVAAACSCMLNILTNLCIFQLFTGESQDYWVQLINLFFGIGGLIGPMITIHYEHKAMKAIGVLFLITLIPFFFLKSPQTHRVEEHEQQKKKKPALGRTAEICICFMFFFYIAEEVGYANWIPTYAFKAKVADPTMASALASIFWITNTIARLVLLYMRGTVTQRLNFLLKCLFICTFIVLVMQWMGYLTFVSYAGVISSGLFLSAMYALFFSLPNEYGFSLSPSNTANFAMSASLGQGLLVMPIGYAMGMFGFKSLIYIIFLFSAIMYFIFIYLTGRLERDKSFLSKQINIPLKNSDQF